MEPEPFESFNTTESDEVPVYKKARTTEQHRTGIHISEPTEVSPESTDTISRIPNPVPESPSSKIIPGRWINWDIYDDFSINIRKLVEFQGWFKFMSFKGVVYVELVQKFYNSMMISRDGNSFTVKIYNSTYKVDISTISEIFMLPNFGTKIGGMKDVTQLRDFNEKQFLKKMTPTHTAVHELHNALLLNPELRILHFFVIHYLCPRIGSQTYISRVDACILWHIVEKVKLNLPYLIFKIMTKSSNLKGLPYAMVLTLFFSAHSIPLSLGSKKLVELKETFVISKNDEGEYSKDDSAEKIQRKEKRVPNEDDVPIAHFKKKTESSQMISVLQQINKNLNLVVAQNCQILDVLAVVSKQGTMPSTSAGHFPTSTSIPPPQSEKAPTPSPSPYHSAPEEEATPAQNLENEPIEHHSPEQSPGAHIAPAPSPHSVSVHPPAPASSDVITPEMPHNDSAPIISPIHEEPAASHVPPSEIPAPPPAPAPRKVRIKHRAMRKSQPPRKSQRISAKSQPSADDDKKGE